MYKVELNKNQLDIYRGDCLIAEGIKPVIFIHQGNKVELLFEDKEVEIGGGNCGNRYSFTYLSKNKYHKAVLNFVCYQDSFILYVDLDVMESALSPTEGINIIIESLGTITALMANYKDEYYWTKPYFGKNINHIPANTQSLLWQSNNQYNMFLPICGELYKTDLQGSKEGMIIKSAVYDSGYNKGKKIPVLAAGVDTDPYRLSRRVTELGFDILGKDINTRWNKKYPEIMEYLGWCSWDAFYRDVNEEGMLKKAEEFNRKQLPVKWFILDDGWMKVKDKSLTSLEVDEKKFPLGLKSLSETLKREYGVRWLGIWHPLMGYWHGIDKNSEFFENLKEYLYKTKANKLIPYPDTVKGFGFWNKWHSYLKEQGIDFVKVDDQSGLSKFTDDIPIAKASKEMHSALEASIGLHFGGTVINCMGMSSEQIWNRPYSSLSRNSNDFYPDKQEDFIDHAADNAYNSFYHGNFYWCDWDMFWTEHKDNLKHSVLRAVSGGPVYISDKLDKTNIKYILPLIFSDGKIIRGEQPGLPTRDCLLKDPRVESVPLKVWNICNGAGFVAFFNINKSEEEVKGYIKPSDINGFNEGKYLVYDFFEQTLKKIPFNSSLAVDVNSDDARLYSIIPCEHKFVALGIIDKYLSTAAVEYRKVYENKAVLLLREGGKFAFYCETEPERMLVEGREVESSLVNNIYTIDCSDLKKKVHIEIEY